MSRTISRSVAAEQPGSMSSSVGDAAQVNTTSTPGVVRRLLESGRRLAGFVWWVASGFGLINLLWRGRAARFKIEEIVVYSVPRAFFLWALIGAGFIGGAVVRHYPQSAAVAEFWGWAYVIVLVYTLLTLLFDVGTLKFLLWSGILGFVWLISRYLEDVRHLAVLSAVSAHLRGLHPTFNPGFASVISWLLLGPWLGGLFHSFSRGRTVFSPNSIEQWHLGEGTEITDRAGLKFRSRYRDLFETTLGFGAGDLEAFDGNHQVTKRWENILFLLFIWKRLDEILHQRSAVVDNAPDDPVEVEAVRKSA